MHVGCRIGARGAHLLEVYCLSIKKLIVKDVIIILFIRTSREGLRHIAIMRMVLVRIE